MVSQKVKDYWHVSRYCFKCKAVRKFLLCDNCGVAFCIDKSHCGWDAEYGDFGHKYYDYPIHAKCM